MLQVARLAQKPLGDAADSVVTFLRNQLNDDGGFKDRAGESDLYYSVFGLDGLIALRADLPASRVQMYLQSFDPAKLDFVHVSCLARCYAALPSDLRATAPRDAILARVESFRAADGAYNATPNSKFGTLYGCFLALGAYEDLGLPIPDPAALLDCADHLRADDGGYANQRDLPVGLTPSTAAAATLMRHLGRTPDPALANWLLARCHPEGGFFATPLAPIPDLLSTATALHALAGMHADFEHLKEPCLDFLDTLWSSQGAFYGNWSDDALDCEYTFYALLSLGHLSI
jgi:prenyltransferase beta subunit